MDVLTREQRHKNMSHIRNKNTKAEVMLRKALWHQGVRYRKNYSALPGKPDIAITRCHIAVFVDGDYWHGRNLEELRKKDIQNKKFWIQKLSGNVKRDQQVNDMLTDMGWIVLRFWETDIKHNLNDIIGIILSYVPVRKTLKSVRQQ